MLRFSFQVLFFVVRWKEEGLGQRSISILRLVLWGSPRYDKNKFDFDKGAMKKITILALSDAAATTITGALDVFGFAGVLYNASCGVPIVPAFEVKIVTPDGLPACCLNGVRITPHCSMSEIEQSDLVVVSAILDIDKTLREQGEIIPWLRTMYHRGSQLAGVCTGAFVLAETGLLDGKEATTHWGQASLFRQRFPEVRLKPERLITDAGDMYCSGAFNSCFDLALYLVEKFCGRWLAVECGKAMVHDTGRIDQTPYTPFLFQHDHNDSDILKIQFEMESRYRDMFDVVSLARRFGMGRRTLERRFRACTGDTPLVYLQRVRVEQAKKILETENMTFEEISYAVGYENSSFFRKIFIKHTGLRPLAYRTKFSRSFDLSVQVRKAKQGK